MELLLVVLSSLPKELFEKGLNAIEDAFGNQEDGALIDRDAGKNRLDEDNFTSWVQPGRSPGINPMLDFIDKRKPRG